MLLDDYVMRQVRKIAELIASIGTGAVGKTHEDLDAELASAYQSLLGMQPDMADRMGPDAWARMLGDAPSIRAGVELAMAHGDLCASRGDRLGAERRWQKALALLEHADDAKLRSEVSSRLASGAPD